MWLSAYRPRLSLTLAHLNTYLMATATAAYYRWHTRQAGGNRGAIIVGPGGSATKTLPDLSGSDGDVVAVEFTGLRHGDWTLDSASIVAPDGILLNILPAAATVAALPLLELTASSSVTLGDAADVVVSASAAPTGPVTATITATRDDGIGTPITRTATLTRTSFRQTVGFPTQGVSDPLTEGIYAFSVSVADSTEQGRVTVPSGTLATLTVTNPAKPEVTVTPMVSGNSLSVGVGVTNDRPLTGTETITLALSDGPSTPPSQTVMLPSGYKRGDAAYTQSFAPLMPGSYTLTATAAPGNINKIVYDGGTQVTILPLVTITSAVNRDVVTVTATVSEGPIGDEAVELTITLRDSSNTTIEEKKPALTSGSVTNSTVSADFSDVPSGDISIGVSAPPNRLRLTNSARPTVLPKVMLTLASNGDGATATAAAEITDGTLDSPVNIMAHIAGRAEQLHRKK